MPEKEFVTWEEVESFVNLVADYVKNSSSYKKYPVTGVYGLPRGGLVLAVMLSHKLNIPILTAPACGCVIVDDICDSGESLLHYVKDTSGIDPKDKAYTIATMYYKENDLGIEPDIWASWKGNKWIVFPWEMEEA